MSLTADGLSGRLLKSGADCGRHDRSPAPMHYNRRVSMSKRGFAATVRLTAILLLAWTAVDLTATQLCPADGQGRPFAINQRDSEALAPSGSTTPVPPPHVDDCFCCSHCVNVGVLIRIRAIAAATACDPVPDVRIPPDDGHPLYHPPQLS